METPAIAIATPLSAQQKYRLTEKCKVARAKYYETKGKAKAHEYYLKNREVMLKRSKERYHQIIQQPDASYDVTPSGIR